MPLSKIQAESINLADTFAFTGTTATENGFNLLSVYDQTSAVVNLNSDTLTHDFGSTALSKYKQFLVQTILQNESNGTMHCYFRYEAANGSTPTWQGQIKGSGSAGTTNTPFQGDSSYVCTAFRLAPNGSMVTKQVISNAKGKTDVSALYNILYETQWLYSGLQSANAQGAVRGTDTASATQKVKLKVEGGGGSSPSSYTGDGNCRVMSWAWGVGIA